MYRAATLAEQLTERNGMFSDMRGPAGRRPVHQRAHLRVDHPARLCPSHRGSRNVTCCPPAWDQGAVSHQIGPAEARVPPGDVIGMYHDRPRYRMDTCAAAQAAPSLGEPTVPRSSGSKRQTGVSCSRRVTNWVTIARFPRPGAGPFPCPAPGGTSRCHGMLTPQRRPRGVSQRRSTPHRVRRCTSRWRGGPRYLRWRYWKWTQRPPSWFPPLCRRPRSRSGWPS